MLLPNPINEQPKIEADSKSFAVTVVQGKTKAEFADLEQFSNWIDDQLVMLEKKFVDFETQNSRKNQLQR